MKAQSKTIGMAIGVVLIIAIFTGGGVEQPGLSYFK